ncbi:MAG: hypothetical protein QOH71_4163 [Blastocatellia bacterium]|jgi:hypothetical protein|nr:hypothetical protein [Blastocatellia bacterium]
MKSLKLRLALLFIGTILALGLSHASARAQGCADIDAGSNVYGEYDCRLTNACGGWCYYSCTCSNVFPGYTCDNVLDEAGFEVVQGPQC